MKFAPLVPLQHSRPRWVIVNADDFGMSAGVNEAVAQTYRHGIVTSASLMVRRAAAADAAVVSRELPELSLGLHVDLGEWEFRQGAWIPLYEVVSIKDASAVRTEAWQQLERFRELVGQEPTHLDSHQHVHLHEPARSILVEMSLELAVPLRQFSAEVQYCGGFYAQTGEGQPLGDAVSVSSLQRILRDLPPRITELACHPGLDESLETMYCHERRDETRTLCDSRILATLEEEAIRLISFQGLPFLEAIKSEELSAVEMRHQGGV